MNLLEIAKSSAKEAFVEFFSPITRLWKSWQIRRQLEPEVRAEYEALRKRLKAAGVRNVHFTWGPDAHKLTYNERAKEIIRMLTAHERGEHVPVTLLDD
jgi:hypothetical protein